MPWMPYYVHDNYNKGETHEADWFHPYSHLWLCKTCGMCLHGTGDADGSYCKVISFDLFKRKYEFCEVRRPQVERQLEEQKRKVREGKKNAKAWVQILELTRGIENESV